MAPAALVMLHFAVVGIIGMFGVRIARTGACAPVDDNPSRAGALITRPKLYDRLVGIASFGREARLRRRVIGLAGITPGLAVLDIGCGTGTLLLAAADSVGANGRLCGAEPSAPMVGRARAKAAAEGVNAEFVQAHAQRLPYPDAAFDAALCTMVLHHLPPNERAAALAEARRVLKPGGTLLVADVLAPRSFGALFSIVSVAHLRAPHHLLDLRQLRELATAAGFEAVAEHRAGVAIGILVCKSKREM
jgi:demethylmenaquinone methyltransferase/2-methoxy-6-polyprenyl-1,4-benzoquinol methylase